MTYRDNLELDAGDIRVRGGGQGDWIIIHGKGPDGKRGETAVPRKSVEKLARMRAARDANLSLGGSMRLFFTSPLDVRKLSMPWYAIAKQHPSRREFVHGPLHPMWCKCSACKVAA
jgi:hypothetical protein